MHDYEPHRPARRGSLLGNGTRRRRSLLGNNGGGEEQPAGPKRRGSMFGNNGGSRRRGSFFGSKSSDEAPRPLRRARRASIMAGNEQPSVDTPHEPQPRRGSMGLFSKRRGSMGNRPQRRGSNGFFHRNKDRRHHHEEASEDLAYQVMAAFASFED